MLLSEVIKDLKSAKEFVKVNKIKPKMIIVVWEVDDEIIYRNKEIDRFIKYANKIHKLK